MTTLRETFSEAVRLHKAGYLQPAEHLYRKVLEADPCHVHALSNLGALTYQANRPHEAIQHMRRALALRPEVAEFHVNLAAACRTAHDAAAAAAAYREALRIDPAAPHVHLSLGQTLLDLGQVEEALTHCLEALRLQPGYAHAYSMLAELAAQGRHAFTDEDIQHIQVLLAGGQLSAAHAGQLYFTLATYWEQQGDHDQAFLAYRKGNDLKNELLRQAGRSFDRVQHRAVIDRFIAAFTPDVFARARSYGIPSDQPVFVVGMVRSGTTLVEQILASHPQVFGCGELRDIEQLAETFYAAFATGVDPATVQRLGGLYLERLAGLGGAEATRTIDKMPQNFLHLGMIAILFPHARVVHCRREPLDVCVSAYVQNFQRLAYATSLEDLGFFHREYARLMAHWRQVLPIPVHEVIYEELVADQERVSRNLIAFCGLPWDDRCLAFHKNLRAVQTPSRLQVRQPIYTRAVARWKRFEAHLQPLRDALAGAP
jgi:tetratricopeptide (TPR) repeat protein